MFRFTLCCFMACLLALPVFAEGGSFLPETLITLADGTTKRIQDIKPGDSILAWKFGKGPVASRVKQVVRSHVDYYLVVKADKSTLRGSGSVEVYTGTKKTEILDNLSSSSTIQCFSDWTLKNTTIDSIRSYPATLSSYTLITEEPNNWFASGALVHD